MEISWTENNTPFSEKFQDIYYSPDGGVDETKHVFINGNNIHNRWPSEKFVIGETGFGTGLNFVCALDLWLKKNKSGHLQYISIEKYPLKRSSLELVYKNFPELSKSSALLLNYYPEEPHQNEIYNLDIKEANVSLSLICKEALDCFDHFENNVDAWFLDGFAPSKNKAMWSEEVLSQIGLHSASKATLATFTCAGFVRRGLGSAGFEVQKAKGFGNKKHMIKAFIDAK